jgi:Tfp pilus assembly protein PilV
MSLIETLIALSLFAIGAVTVGNFLVQQIRTSSTNNLYSIACSLAAQEMENIRTLDYASMTSETSTSQVGDVTFTVTTNVTADVPAPNLKSITVDVSWLEPQGPQNVRLSTIYTKITE